MKYFDFSIFIMFNAAFKHTLIFHMKNYTLSLNWVNKWLLMYLELIADKLANRDLLAKQSTRCVSSSVTDGSWNCDSRRVLTNNVLSWLRDLISAVINCYGPWAFHFTSVATYDKCGSFKHSLTSPWNSRFIGKYDRVIHTPPWIRKGT